MVYEVPGSSETPERPDLRCREHEELVREVAELRGRVDKLEVWRWRLMVKLGKELGGEK